MAQAQGLIRDAEIEYALRELARPMANAAGLPPSQLRLLVVADPSLNAFVADSSTIVLHSGLILKLGSVAELQAVLAHELAHIANGHIARRASNAQGAQSLAILGAALAAAVAMAGDSQAAIGLAVGSGSAAMRGLLAHTRAEEASADQSGLRYMAQAGVDPDAMLRVLDIFRGQEALNVGRQDPYVMTHPLTRDRIRAVEAFAQASGARTAQPDATTQYWFARAQGKLGAFLQAPSFTLRQIAKGDTSDAALMRRAVAYHRQANAGAALAQMDQLAARRPEDAFIQELRGQILLESGNFGAAVAAYGRAVQLAPRESLLQAGLGHALLALNTPDGNRRGLAALEQARGRDAFDPRMLRDLALAYARAGNNGMASVATAERYAVLGRLADAAIHARRAQGLLPHGSPGWLRAEDILRAAPPAK